MGHHTKNQAFTIVELLIVVVVIAILATITIVAFRGITERAAAASVQSDLRSAATTLELDYQRNGTYPATIAAANDGKGITLGGGNQIHYGTESYGYCVHISNSQNGKVARIRSSSGQIEDGQGCKALSAFATVGASFARSTAVTQSRTFTMPTTYSAERWLVGAVIRRNQTTTPTVTVDSTTVSSPLHINAAGYGYTWFVVQPTGASTTIQFTGASTASEYGFAAWEVFAPVKPVLEDTASAVVNTPAVIDGYPGGAALAAAIYPSSTVPGGSFNATNVGSGAGWYMYTGGVFPAGVSEYTLSVPSESGTAVMVRAG